MSLREPKFKVRYLRTAVVGRHYMSLLFVGCFLCMMSLVFEFDVTTPTTFVIVFT